jgi:hypothetical protein
VRRKPGAGADMGSKSLDGEFREFREFDVDIGSAHEKAGSLMETHLAVRNFF